MIKTNQLGILLFTFMCLIVGIPLLTALADQISLVDQTYTVTDEYITLSNLTATSLANNWVTSVSSVVARNESANVTMPSSNYTVGYLNTETRATILAIDPGYGNADVGNYTHAYVNYTYQDDNYIRGSPASQTLVKLIVVFFVIGILACGIYGLTRSGILDQLK
jgi:hypothetical protein